MLYNYKIKQVVEMLMSKLDQQKQVCVCVSVCVCVHVDTHTQTGSVVKVLIGL